MTKSKCGHNKCALLKSIKHICHLGNTLLQHNKILSKNHKNATSTCQVVSHILKSQSRQLKNFAKLNKLIEERVQKSNPSTITHNIEKSSLKVQLALMKELLSHFKSQTVSAQDNIKFLKKLNQELLVDVRKLERSSTVTV